MGGNIITTMCSCLILNEFMPANTLCGTCHVEGSQKYSYRYPQENVVELSYQTGSNKKRYLTLYTLTCTES